MRAIILAAGRGSRMKAVTQEKHKSLVRIRGKRLIDWQLEALYNCGLKDVAVVTGYRRSDLGNLGLKEFYNPRWKETNMVGSLMVAEDWLSTDTCIISYSDIFYNKSAIESLLQSCGDIAITYDPNWLKLWEHRFFDPLSDAESFKIDGDGMLNEIGRRPNSVSEVQGQYMGLLKLSPTGWNICADVLANLNDFQRDAIDMTSLLSKVLEKNKTSVVTLPYYDEWGEVDFESDFQFYNSKN